MKRITAIVLSLLMMTALLCSCNNVKSIPEDSGNADSTYISDDDIKLLLINNYASDNGKGNHYNYVVISSITDENGDEYRVFSQRLVNSGDNGDQNGETHIAYIFVCTEKETAFVGSYNNESGQYKFEKEIHIFNGY